MGTRPNTPGVSLVALALTALALGACGSSEEAASDEDQIRAVARTAAEAFATQDAAEVCDVADTSKLVERARSIRPEDLTSRGKDLVKLLEEEGPQALCEDLARQELLKDLSAEEKADAKSLEIVRVKIEGDKATADVRTHNDKTDATFRRVDGEWKLVGSTALE